MKQFFSALLIVSLFLQPLFGQTTNPSKTTKPAPEAPAEIVPIEDLLPADTLAYVASTNLAGVLHRFELLDAYKTAQARLPKEALEAGDNPLSVVTRFLSFGIENSRALEDTRIGVALILPELPEETEEQKKAKAADPNLRQPMPEPLLLVFVEGARMEDAREARAQFLAYYNETFRPIGKLSEIKQIEYKGTKVDRFKNGDIGQWFGATYVLSQPEAIDRLRTLRTDRRADRLADEPEFIRMRTQMMPQTGLFAYLNGKPLNNLLKSVLGSGGGGFGPTQILFSALSGIDAIKSAALASTFDRDGVMDRLQLNFDPARKNPLSAFFGPKAEFKATPYIPVGTEILVSHNLDWATIYDEVLVKMLYTAQASQELMKQYYAEYEVKRKEAEAKKEKPPEMDWGAIQQRIKTELTEEKIQQKAKEREAEVNQELGFVLREEVVKDLANEVTVAYGIPKMLAAAAVKEGEEGKSQNEGWAVFIGIKDRAATQQALIKAFSYFMSGMGMGNASNNENDEAPPAQPVKTEEQRKQERELRDKNAQSAWAMMPSEIYKKVEIKSVFAAYLGFSDEFLIVADSKETIKHMLDLAEAGRAIATDFNYSRAMSSLGGTGATKVFIGPKWFDETLQGFIESWVANPATLDPAAALRAPLNVPATAAAALENDNGNLKLELFSPLGIAGTVALWGFGSDVKQATERNESAARQQLWELRKAEKLYAKKHENKYATLETLAKAKVTVFDVEQLKSEEGNYKFTFKLKPDGKGYEATATPIKYGRQGRKSFFIDETDKLRAADKQGAIATASDEMVEERVFGEEDTAEESDTPRRGVRRQQ